MDKATRGDNDLTCEERPLRHANLTESYLPDTSYPDRMSGHAVNGTMRRLTVRDGFNISSIDLGAPKVFKGTARSEPSLVIAVFLDCAGRGFATSELAPTPLEVPYPRDTLMFCFSRTATEATYDVPASSRFRVVEVRLSHTYLQQIMALDLFLNATRVHPFHVTSNDGLWVGTIPLANAVRACAERILRAAHTNPSDDLSVEADGLTILNSAINAMRTASGADLAEVAQNRPKLEAARRLLLGNLAHGWSLAEVANAVDITEKRLKAGFRAAFGMPVHTFLQNARLERACQLLNDGNHSVTEVSLAVGYANPSHFAFLYRRAFGTPPSAREVRKR